MTADCPRDGRPINDNAYVCRSCGEQLAQALGNVSALADELDVSLSRQTGGGYRIGGRGADKPLPYDTGASEAGWVLKNTLVSWVRELIEDGEQWPHDTLTDIARWLLASVEDMRRREDAEMAVDEITAAVASVTRVIDRRAERVYAGICHHISDDGLECIEPLYGRPEKDGVTCNGCGERYSVKERRDDMLDTLNDMLFTAAEIATLAKYLDVLDGRDKVRKLINTWGNRKILEVHGLTLEGVPRYKFSEAVGMVVTRRKAA